MIGLIIFSVIAICGCLSLGSLVWSVYVTERDGYITLASLLGKELEEEVDRAKPDD